MLKSIFLSTLLFLSFQVFSQSRLIKGKIIGNALVPLPSATVKIVGKPTFSISNSDGLFEIMASDGNVSLQVTAVGYTEKIVAIAGNENQIDIALVPSDMQLSEVVVSALGVYRKSRSLTYSTQTIGNQEFSTVKNTNVLNSLSGKVAGVQINRSSGGAGGSARVVIRGEKSTRSSQPLYVIDGMPIINPTGGPDAGLYNARPDQGDILSSINPDDIESFNILKGPSATALYGSQGSNGVILITTKKGKSGVSRIDFNSSITFDNVSVLPELQTKYTQTKPYSDKEPGSEDSWGAAGATNLGSNYVKDFFQTGSTFINSVSFTSGSDKSSNFLSYSNTNNIGIIPTSGLDQHTINFKQTSKLFKEKLVIDGSVLASFQNVKNRLTPGVYTNPLSGLYLFPRGIDFNQFKDFEYFSNSRYIYSQNWWNINLERDIANGGGWGGQDYQQNPYWVLHRNASLNKNKNFYGNVVLKYALTNWLKLQARGSINVNESDFDRKLGATTQATLARSNGKYISESIAGTVLYGDLLLIGDRSLNKDLGLSFTLGTSIQDTKGKGLKIAGFPTVANVFIESALEAATIGINNDATPYLNKQVQSVFLNTTFNFQEKIYLDLTCRNDWSSTLAYTPAESKGYFYYSIGTGIILSDLLKLPTAINFAKINASYTTVGNDILAYSTHPLYTFDFGGTAIPPDGRPITTVLGFELKPEFNKSLELGLQTKFMNNKLGIDFNWYRSRISHQYFSGIFTSVIGGSTKSNINAGEIENKGVELSISYKVVENKQFSWNSSLNFTKNVNKIIELFDPKIVKGADADTEYPLASGGGYSKLKLNGSFSDLYGRTFKLNAEGKKILNDKNLPVFVDSLFGNASPKFLIGWNNSFNIGKLSVGFLIDGRFGGEVLSITQGYLDQMGVSKRTADVRDKGDQMLIPNAVDATGKEFTGTVEAKKYYQHIGGKTPAGAAYVYDATTVRLREISLSYQLPIQSSVIKDFRLSLIGNNLFYFVRKAPFDSDLVAGNNAGGVGIDAFGLPAYRSVGFSIKCSL